MFIQFLRLLHALLTLIVFLGVLSPSTSNGASGITLTPRLTISETYDDNLDLVNDKIEDPDSDWITTVAPGFQLRYEEPKTDFTLDYELGLEYYLNESRRDTTRHNGLLSWNYRFTPSISWSLTNRLLISDDPVTVTDAQTVEVAQERATRYRNYGEASLFWQYGPENVFTGGYRNRFFASDSNDEEESIANEVFLNLENWFSPRIGINVESYGNRTEFDQPSGYNGIPTDNFYQCSVGVTINYRWQPQRIFYARYRILGQDFDHSNTSTSDNSSTSDNYIIHEPTLGFNLTLSPQTQFIVEGGYFKQEFINRNYGTHGFSGNLSLNTQIYSASTTITAYNGYELDYTTPTNYGFSKIRRVRLTAQYPLTRNISVTGSGEYTWEDYAGVDLTDQTFSATALVDYTIRPWLRLSLEGTRLRRESTDNTQEFRDYRFTFSLRWEPLWRIK